MGKAFTQLKPAAIGFRPPARRGEKRRKIDINRKWNIDFYSR
jgi:hypothetical protein